SVIVDRAGREAARTETPFSLAMGQRLELEQRLQVASPQLWSLATPNLYALRTVLLEGSRVTDSTTTTFGIRTIAYDKDRGFLVMAEAFDEWTMGKVAEGYHRYFADWSERDVTDFVQRDRNHPSIVLWSAGNEIGEQTTADGPQVLKRLVDIFHREDPTRPVT